MTRYLLGELSEQEQAALEQKYFRDQSVFNQVLKVESELLDAYSRGQLSTETREQFENSYLNHPSRRRRVEFAKALTTRIDEREAARTQVAQPTSSVSWWQSVLNPFGGDRPKLRFAMALVAVLVVLSGVWIVVNNLRRQQQPTPIQAKRENDEPRKQEPPPQTPQQDQVEHTAQVPTTTSQPSPSPVAKPASKIVYLALSVGGVRAGGRATQTLVVPAEAIQAQIYLNLKDDTYPQYRASLQKIGGSEIFTQSNVRPRRTKSGAKFVFTVRATQLTKGDYALTLSGLTPQGEVDDLSKSIFRVEKK